MIFQLPVTLLSIIGWVALVDAIPTDPTITPAAILPRQADSAFIGWISDNGTWTTQKCDPSLTWYQSGDYAQCCPDTRTACPAPTACVGGTRGSQIYPFSGTTITTACTENYRNASYSICNTAFIFESFGDSNPKTDILCGPSSQNWSFYRQVPASITEFPTPSSKPSEPAKSESKAWIAGAVAGPIIGIALIAGIIFFLMRRKKTKQTVAPQAGVASMGPPPGVQNYTDAKPQLANPAYGQTPPGVNDTYNHQTYNQQGYAQQPTSPATQYQQPYAAPVSPPPQQSVYATQNAKFGYTAQPQRPNAAELGGMSTPVGGSHTAELSSEPRRT